VNYFTGGDLYNAVCNDVHSTRTASVATSTYPYNALEPVISAEALRIHHDMHHKAYVDGLNRAEINLVEARKNNDFKYIKYWENQLAFNGSGHILHSIFWTVMAPLGRGGKPGIHTTNQINSYFGSFNAFAEQFKKRR